VRICSLLPSASEIVAALGHADALVGVSDECRWPPELVGKPVVTAARIDPSALSSREIDTAVRASLAAGGSLYAFDAELIEELEPDLVVTQDLCNVCAVSGGDVATALPLDVEVLSLDPCTLAEVAETFRLLARRLGTPERGDELAREFDARIEAVAEAVRELPGRRVFFAEWLDPPFCAGHWIPEMISLAGGEDVLGRAGVASRSTTWYEALAHDPELVILAPCGFGAEEALRRSADLDLDRPAVAVDGDGYYSCPGPRLADGVRQLGHILHSEAVEDPGLPALQLVRAGASGHERQSSPEPRNSGVDTGAAQGIRHRGIG
jgi:iron complex transport system substrate-binding protein